MRPNLPGGQSGAMIDADRLLAFSSLLRKRSCEFESIVLGGSMGKALPPGSRIRIRFASDSNLAAGQIVTYLANGRIVAHRLVKLAASHGDRYVITRGDGTVCCDAPVPASAVLGILTERQTNGVWEPVAQPEPRSFGFQWLAHATTQVVLAALRLDPCFSIWAARCIFEARVLAVRGVEFVKRHFRFFLFKQRNNRA